MLVSIVTPCFNAKPLIGETVASVLQQKAIVSGRVELEYLVCDGASTDGTREVIEAFRAPCIQLTSEPDAGMYEALGKGLARASGDVVAYLNAGDYYHPSAFDVLADLFADPGIAWLTGYNAMYSATGAVTNVTLPFRYRKSLFQCGAYGVLLPFVQQESTFWRRDLMAALDLQALSRLRYAGDSYLWTIFSRRARLHVAQAVLGGFRFHAGQLSENRDAYRAELRTFTRAPGPHDLALACFDRAMWLMPARIKKYLNADGLMRFDHQVGRWR